MKIAKSLLTITLALVFVFSAVGCGGATAVPATAAPATAAPATAAPATAAPATAAPEPTPVVGEFGTCDHPTVLWSGLTGSDAGHFAKLLTQFATENPDACVASQGYVWDTFFQKYPTATAAGSPPDMVIFHATEVEQMASAFGRGETLLARLGQLLLLPLFAQLGLGQLAPGVAPL